MKQVKVWGLVSLVALMVGLFGALAVEAAPPTPATISVAAGQTATAQVNVFCLDFGKDFPAGQNIQPGALADQKLVNALSYAIDKGYDQSNPRQTQLALWYLRDNTYHTNAGESTTIAQEIVNASNTAAPATTPASGSVALSDAVKNNQVTLSATGLKPLTQGEYYGTATLQIQNSGSNNLTLTVAPGTTFTANGANYQTLIGYVTGAQGAPAAQATTAAATTAAATTAAATTATATTTTAATTAAATTAAVATTSAATTTVATTTAATTTAPTTVAATTAAATTAAPTATVAAASVPAAGEGGGASSNGGGTILLSLLVLALIAMTAITGLAAIKGRRN